MRLHLSSVAVVFLCAAIAHGDEQSEANKVLERAVAAMGGQKELAKAGAYALKVDGKIEAGGMEVKIGGNWSLQGLDRFRWEAEATAMGRTEQVTLLFVGDKGWAIDKGGKANEMPADFAPPFANALRCFRMAQNPLLLQDKAVKLSPLGELKVNDRATIGLKITQAGRPDVDLFLDKQTNLPYKIELRQKEPPGGQEALHAFIFERYKEVGGIKHFTKLKFIRDDMTLFDLDLTEITASEKLDDSVFAKPEKK